MAAPTPPDEPSDASDPGTPETPRDAAPEALLPSASVTEMTELVLPQHANALGPAFGGTALPWIDVCAAIASQRHCGTVAVTASIDEVEFRAPIRVGDVVRLTGRVNAAFRTSVEVEVVVETEDTVRRQRTVAVDALLTFVKVDPAGRPAPVPALRAETPEERARAEAAVERRRLRLLRKRRPGA